MEKGEKPEIWKVFLKNTGTQAVVGLKLEDSREPDGKNFLFFDDNYFYLLPGETKLVTVTAFGKDTPMLRLTGFQGKE